MTEALLQPEPEEEPQVDEPTPAAFVPDLNKIKLAMNEIDKQFAKGTIIRVGDNSIVPVNSISTGALSLDVALGLGGLPRGRIVEIYGPESSSKSTLCLSIIAEAQKMGGICVLIDTEHSIDPQYAARVGVNMDDLLFSQPSYGEMAIETAIKLLRTGQVSVVVSDSVASALEPYVIFPERKAEPIDVPVEINTADSAALRSVAGIGEKTVVSIIGYRDRLGGFLRAEQLAEVPGVTERNYEKILKQIYCDSCEIRKIDINFASPKELGRHPYIPPQTLRKLLKRRQLKGGWSTAEELIEDDIMTREEAARLVPYLRFGARSGPDDE